MWSFVRVMNSNFCLHIQRFLFTNFIWDKAHNSIRELNSLHNIYSFPKSLNNFYSTYKNNKKIFNLFLINNFVLKRIIMKDFLKKYDCLHCSESNNWKFPQRFCVFDQKTNNQNFENLSCFSKIRFQFYLLYTEIICPWQFLLEIFNKSRPKFKYKKYMGNVLNLSLLNSAWHIHIRKEKREKNPFQFRSPNL